MVYRGFKHLIESGSASSDAEVARRKFGLFPVVEKTGNGVRGDLWIGEVG